MSSLFKLSVDTHRVQSQCEQSYKWLKNGKIDGVVFCSNCVADLGLETVEWTKKWIAKIADETIGPEMQRVLIYELLPMLGEQCGKNWEDAVAVHEE